MSAVRTRVAAPRDTAAVRAVLLAAFPSAAEADLVDNLRSDGDLVTALVAEDDQVVGAIVFSRLALDSDISAVALAPLAVTSARQRQGIGAALVKAGIARLRRRGDDLALVLGDPAYYRRFGFTAAIARGLSTPYDGAYLQALGLTERGAAARGVVRYPAAFAKLG